MCCIHSSLETPLTHIQRLSIDQVRITRQSCSILKQPGKVLMRCCWDRNVFAVLKFCNLQIAAIPWTSLTSRHKYKLAEKCKLAFSNRSPNHDEASPITNTELQDCRQGTLPRLLDPTAQITCKILSAVHKQVLLTAAPLGQAAWLEIAQVSRIRHYMEVVCKYFFVLGFYVLNG